MECPTSCSDISGTTCAMLVTGFRAMYSLACSSFGLMSASICGAFMSDRQKRSAEATSTQSEALRLGGERERERERERENSKGQMHGICPKGCIWTCSAASGIDECYIYDRDTDMQTADDALGSGCFQWTQEVHLHMACATRPRSRNSARIQRAKEPSPRLPRRQTWGSARTAGAASRNCGTSVCASEHTAQSERRFTHWHAIPAASQNRPRAH